jgi:hypothetical protein
MKFSKLICEHVCFLVRIVRKLFTRLTNASGFFCIVLFHGNFQLVVCAKLFDVDFWYELFVLLFFQKLIAKHTHELGFQCYAWKNCMFCYTDDVGGQTMFAPLIFLFILVDDGAPQVIKRAHLNLYISSFMLYILTYTTIIETNPNVGAWFWC